MQVQTTPAFVEFSEAAAKECASTTGKILFLNYAYVKTQTAKGYKWVLDVVSRADFPGASVMIVNGWEMLYQPEMKEELTNGILDFRNREISVRRI